MHVECALYHAARQPVNHADMNYARTVSYVETRSDGADARSLARVKGKNSLSLVRPPPPAPSPTDPPRRTSSPSRPRARIGAPRSRPVGCEYDRIRSNWIKEISSTSSFPRKFLCLSDERWTRLYKISRTVFPRISLPSFSFSRIRRRCYSIGQNEATKENDIDGAKRDTSPLRTRPSACPPRRAREHRKIHALSRDATSLVLCVYVCTRETEREKRKGEPSLCGRARRKAHVRRTY